MTHTLQSFDMKFFNEHKEKKEITILKFMIFA